MSWSECCGCAIAFYAAYNNNNNNNNGYFSVLFLRRAHSPFVKIYIKNIKTHKKQNKQQRCEHIIRKNKQIKSTVHDAN